jgi:hypothetical protein
MSLRDIKCGWMIEAAISNMTNVKIAQQSDVPESAQ